MSFLLFGISFDALKDYTRTFCGPEGANEPGIIGVFLRFFNVFPPGLFFGTVFSFYGLLVADSAFQDLTQNLTGYYEYNIKYYTSWENIILYVVIFFICLETTFGLLLSHFAGGFDVTFSLVILMSQLVQTIFSLAVLCLSICGTMLGALFSSTIFPFEMFRRYCNFADVYSDLYCISGKNYGFFYSTLYCGNELIELCIQTNKSKHSWFICGIGLLLVGMGQGFIYKSLREIQYRSRVADIAPIFWNELTKLRFS